MKHTPGPWRYEKQNPSPTTGEHMIAGGLPGYLAEIRDCGSGKVEDNARLIAAAPDLLAALLHVIPHVGTNYSGKQRHDILETARAAIAKATGE